MLHRFFTESIKGSEISQLEKRTTTMPFYTGLKKRKSEKKKPSILKSSTEHRTNSSNDSRATKKNKANKRQSQVVFALNKKKSLPKKVAPSSSSSEDEFHRSYKIHRKPRTPTKSGSTGKTGSRLSKTKSSIESPSMAAKEIASAFLTSKSNPSSFDNKTSSSTREATRTTGTSNKSEEANRSQSVEETSKTTSTSRSQEIIKHLNQSYSSANSTQTSQSTKVDQSTQSEISETGKSYETSDIQTEFPEKKVRRLYNSSKSSKSPSNKTSLIQSRTASTKSKSSVGLHRSTSGKYTTTTNASLQNTLQSASTKSPTRSTGQTISESLGTQPDSSPKTSKNISSTSRSKTSNYTNFSNNSKGHDSLNVNEGGNIEETKDATEKVNEVIDNEMVKSISDEVEKSFTDIDHWDKDSQVKSIKIGKDSMQWEVYPLKQDTNLADAQQDSIDCVSSKEDPKESETSTHLVTMTGHVDHSEGKVRSESKMKMDVAAFLREAQKYTSSPEMQNTPKVEPIESDEKFASQRQVDISSENTFTTYPPSVTTRPASSQALTNATTEYVYSDASLQNSFNTYDMGSSSLPSQNVSLSDIVPKVGSKTENESRYFHMKVSDISNRSQAGVSYFSEDDLRLHPCPSATNLSSPSSIISRQRFCKAEYHNLEKNSDKNSFVSSSTLYRNTISNVNQRTRGNRKLSRSPMRRVFVPASGTSQATMGTMGSNFSSRISTYEPHTDEGNGSIDLKLEKEKHHKVLDRKTTFQSQPHVNVVSKTQPTRVKAKLNRAKNYKSMPSAMISLKNPIHSIKLLSKN